MYLLINIQKKLSRVFTTVESWGEHIRLLVSVFNTYLSLKPRKGCLYIES